MPIPKKNPVLLVILDGWGVNPDSEGNAIAQADPPYWKELLQNYSHTTLEPGGQAVGLPEGQFGNSEVGHLNLGAGRVVYQDITRIDRAIESGEFHNNPAFGSAVDSLGPDNKLHLMGLVSDGGVHSSDRHYFALMDLLKNRGLDADRVCFHLITDGRDTNPASGYGYAEKLNACLREKDAGRIVSLSGRYWGMDRDNNWDRIRRFWEMVTQGKAPAHRDVLGAIRESYDSDVTDEFIKPVLISESDQPDSLVQDGDSIIFFNFRADRARQICRAFTEGDDFDRGCFERTTRPRVKLVTMTAYLNGLEAEVAFRQEPLVNSLGEYLSIRDYRQFRCAETEKYAHVTYFFNGGTEEPFAGEDRCLIPSPKVATYDFQPQMSLPAVAEKVVSALRSKEYGFVLTNFANGDMVGHTGVFEAALRAVGAVDEHLQLVVKAARESGYEVLVTSDHGNCEVMIDHDGQPTTNHSHNRVPLVYLPQDGRNVRLREGGSLCDIAPTVLQMMGENQPEEMTGRSLIE